MQIQNGYVFILKLSIVIQLVSYQY